MIQKEVKWFDSVEEMRESLRAENQPEKVYEPVLADGKEKPSESTPKAKKGKKTKEEVSADE